MMKTWKNYAKLTFAKMQAAEENGVDYVFSDSEEEDSQEVESEYEEDSYYEQEDESPESHEDGYFESRSPANELIEEEEEEEEPLDITQKESTKIKSGLVNDEDREMLSHLQGEMADGNPYSAHNLSVGLKPPQGMTRRSLSPFIVEKKDPVPGERNRSLSTLTPPKIFMHSAEGEIHDLTPKVSNRGDKSFAYHASNPDSKNLNDN